MFALALTENPLSFNFKLSIWKSFFDFIVSKQTNINVKTD